MFTCHIQIKKKRRSEINKSSNLSALFEEEKKRIFLALSDINESFSFVLQFHDI